MAAICVFGAIAGAGANKSEPSERARALISGGGEDQAPIPVVLAVLPAYGAGVTSGAVMSRESGASAIDPLAMKLIATTATQRFLEFIRLRYAFLSAAIPCEWIKSRVEFFISEP